MSDEEDEDVVYFPLELGRDLTVEHLDFSVGEYEELAKYNEREAWVWDRMAEQSDLPADKAKKYKEWADENRTRVRGFKRLAADADARMDDARAEIKKEEQA